MAGENTSLPATTRQWTMDKSRGTWLDALELENAAPVPSLRDTDCLVRMEAASLNYRDVAMLQGNYPYPFNAGLVPGSDGAGVVIAVGGHVTNLKVGDRVCTLFHQGWESGLLTADIRATTLGNYFDGVLREFAVFPEHGLVPVPRNLSSLQAAALPCAAVTAWNALFGLESRVLQRGQTILVQGTGGVSLFAAQFAQGLGATVIATTSSEDKAEKLRKMGVQHVINYTDTPDWGVVARKLSPGGQGVDHIVEVGGNSTIQQSFRAIKIEGVISMIGFLGGKDAATSANFIDCLTTLCILRGVNVGSKEQFLAMNEFMALKEIVPVLDERVFGMDELKDAYRFLWDRKQWGKVVVKIS
ncbi:hypothetical protein LTR84_004927 [Exophiala bonariae]|uniref:Enoyl reductase (ER) domain-containing protein n=1 Tax=Exophiala bonariae TaxID=1690606 RepID=A0AAV9NQV4_9EURO|nr:hypothetical protein LTR84_004927 [Exophiala bonariae]